MISEQVKRLRKLANQWKHNDVAGYHLMLNACDTIEALSAKVRAADRPTGWIPVSERLPNKEDCPMDCVVTRRSDFIGNYVDMAVCEKNGTWTHEDWDAIVLGDVESGKSTGLITTRDDSIIAWMPLPEPYKGGESDG